MSRTFHDADFSEELNGLSAKRFKMNNPDTQNNTFLFTSESVGEGHPGKLYELLRVSSCTVARCRRVFTSRFLAHKRCCLNFVDKICDQVSDAILDAHLKQDPNAKVACGKCK